MSQCPTCNGTGKVAGGPGSCEGPYRPCDDCGGKGEVTTRVVKAVADLLQLSPGAFMGTLVYHEEGHPETTKLVQINQPRILCDGEERWGLDGLVAWWTGIELRGATIDVELTLVESAYVVLREAKFTRRPRD